MSKGKAIALKFLRNSESSRRFFSFTTNLKSVKSDHNFVPKGKAIALLPSQNSESFKEFFNFTPNSKSAKRQGYRLTIFPIFRKFQEIFQFYTKLKRCQSDHQFVPKGKAIAFYFCKIQNVSRDFCVSHQIEKGLKGIIILCQKARL